MPRAPSAATAAPGALHWPTRSSALGDVKAPNTRSLLATTVFLASNMEEGKVYNKVYVITFSHCYLKGRLKFFSGSRIIFLYCCKA